MEIKEGKMRIAKKLLAKKYKIEEIKEKTGLSEKKINEISKKMAMTL